MRASSGTSGFLNGASAKMSDIPRLLSRFVALVAGLGALSSPSLVVAAEPATNGCVAVRAEAPYRGSGYDHLVKLHNHCEKLVKCRVSSDVHPEVTEVAVPAKGNAEVLLWRGSPARTFKARVSCD